MAPKKKADRNVVEVPCSLDGHSWSHDYSPPFLYLLFWIAANIVEVRKGNKFVLLLIFFTLLLATYELIQLLILNQYKLHYRHWLVDVLNGLIVFHFPLTVNPISESLCFNHSAFCIDTDTRAWPSKSKSGIFSKPNKIIQAIYFIFL
jgi:hypothetical protein